MDRNCLLYPLLLTLCASTLQSVATDDLQIYLQPALSGIELFNHNMADIGLKITGINCSQQLNDAENVTDNSTSERIVPDYEIEARKEITNVTTSGYDINTTGNDGITTGYDVIPVNVTYVIDNAGLIYIIQESHILLSNVSDINTHFQFTPTNVGPVKINITFTWVCQNETHETSSTYYGTVNGIISVDAQTGLRYFTSFLTVICVAIMGIHIGPGVLELPTYGPVLSSYLPSQIVIPLVLVILSWLLNVAPAVQAGLLAQVISPPALLVLPIAAIMDADLSLVVTILLVTPVLSFGVMPLWLLVINGLDPRLGLTPDFVPFTTLLFSFMLPTFLIFSGIKLTSCYPSKMAVFKSALIPMTMLTLFFSFLTTIVGVSAVEVWGGGMLAILSLVQSLILLLACMAGQALFHVEPSKIKSIFLLTALNSELVAFNLIENALPPRELAYAVAATNLRSMMGMIFQGGFLLVICGCSFIGKNPHLPFAARSQEEKEKDKESPAKQTREVLVMGGVNANLYTPISGSYHV